MLTKLIFPPQWIPTQPYLSLPSLMSFLRAHDCNVEQMDINVSFYDEILSRKGVLSFFFERAYSKFQELESRKELPPELQKKYATLSSSILFSDYIIDEIDNAKKVIRDREKFYDIEELFRAFKVLELGLKLASSAYHPANLTFHSYDMHYSCRSSRDILDAINDPEENLFIDYFEKNVIPAVLRNRPKLVGISIINTSQLIPGLTLASLIKKANESIHINIGGSVLTRLVNEISQNDKLFCIFDSVIVHEGETALLKLIQNLQGECDIEDVPNLIYRDGSEIRVNKISSDGEDINSLPTPCFDGLPLSLYFSPELILPVLSSRGCYWRRCTFCDHGYGYSGKYRPRDVGLLYDDLKTLKNKYGTRFFTFQDEGVSQRLIGALSDSIIKNNLDISWLADSRFEPSFSADHSNKIAGAGCEMLYFGLESASDRILMCMDKGIRKDQVLKICKLCSDAGIWTHLFLIFGFPTETRDEAEETMDFILRNNGIIRSMSFGSFQLTKHSKVYENTESFGVRRIIKDDSLDLSLWYEYEVARGMSKRETDELIQEFYSRLSLQYRDLPIWSNLDREHLFLYISRYRRKKNAVPGLNELIDRIHSMRSKSRPTLIDTGNIDPYPRLNEGVFIGSFNFNLGLLIHTMMAGDGLNYSLKKERTNVLFDTNSNRILTVSDFGKDIVHWSNGQLNLSEIINFIKEKYGISYAEAEIKCRNFLSGLLEKDIVTY